MLASPCEITTVTLFVFLMHFPVCCVVVVLLLLLCVVVVVVCVCVCVHKNLVNYFPFSHQTLTIQSVFHGYNQALEFTRMHLSLHAFIQSDFDCISGMFFLVHAFLWK